MGRVGSSLSKRRWDISHYKAWVGGHNNRVLYTQAVRALLLCNHLQWRNFCWSAGRRVNPRESVQRQIVDVSHPRLKHEA